MKKGIFRLAALEDAEQILKIYKYYIEETTITFECFVPSTETFYERVRKITAQFPFLVHERDGKIVGYAYASSPLAEDQQAYMWNVELSIYMNRECTSRGLGKRFYTGLLEILALQNIQNVYGGITLPNEKSAALHKSLGFTKVSLYKKNGYKLGKWHDVLYFEKFIGQHERKPAPVVPIGKIPAQQIEKILAKI